MGSFSSRNDTNDEEDISLSGMKKKVESKKICLLNKRKSYKKIYKIFSQADIWRTDAIEI